MNGIYIFNIYKRLYSNHNSAYYFDLLMKHLNFNYKSNDIIRNVNGKPYLKNNPFYFSITHSGEYLIIAISDKQIGIDTEMIKERKLNKVIDYAFNNKEIALIKIEGLTKFYELWCSKEAVCKFYGLGINLNFKDIDIIHNTLVYKNKVYNYPKPYHFKFENYILAIICEEICFPFYYDETINDFKYFKY